MYLFHIFSQLCHPILRNDLETLKVLCAFYSRDGALLCELLTQVRCVYLRNSGEEEEAALINRKVRVWKTYPWRMQRCASSRPTPAVSIASLGAPTTDRECWVESKRTFTFLGQNVRRRRHCRIIHSPCASSKIVRNIFADFLMSCTIFLSLVDFC